MVGFVLRNTLSDFGSVARGVCKADSNGYLQAVSEMTSIERDGDHAKNTDPQGNVTQLTGDEARLHEHVGIYARGLPATPSATSSSSLRRAEPN